MELIIDLLDIYVIDLFVADLACPVWLEIIEEILFRLINCLKVFLLLSAPVLLKPLIDIGPEVIEAMVKRDIQDILFISA